MVYSFSPEGNKRRVSTYAGLDFYTAFLEIVRRLAEGKLIVVTDMEGYRTINKKEIEDGKRVTYDFACNFSVYPHGENISNVQKYCEL